MSDVFVGGGEMGALMRSTDWSKTKLGPVEDWPSSLKTMLGVVLGSRFPMLLWWGPDLLHLYNDAYRPILREKHPASLGAPAAEVWAEVWNLAGPMARSVQEGGPATWTEDLQLFIHSGGMAEETYFTFSYSPVPGDDGRVGGVLNTVQETTAKVQSERQVRMLHDLAARAAEAKSKAEAYRIAAEILSTNELDLPFVLLYALNEKTDDAELVAVSGWKDYEGRGKPARVSTKEDLTASAWPFGEVLRTRQEIVVDGLASRFGPLPLGRWNATCERAIILPLFRAGQSSPSTFLVTGVSPHRALDAGYRRFFRATADLLANAIANAGTYEAEKKRAETLTELDHAKTVFFSNISHEFRTPLTLLLGPTADSLGDKIEPLSAAHRTRLELVQDNAQRLLKLVNALLDFSRIEAGRMRGRFRPTDLAALTRVLASMFTSACDSVSLRLEIDCPPLTSAAWVDREMWEKIVLNLVSNAFKFTFAGGIRVGLRETSAAFELSVADSGTGIPEHELPRIFERFHRIEGAKSRTHEGTGIGLSLVHELVALHGGELRVESQVDRGTTFMLSIPKGCTHLPADALVGGEEYARGIAISARTSGEVRQWIPLQDDSPALVASGQDADECDGSGSLAKPYLLLVDDNADLRHYISMLLAPHYSVETALDGVQALGLVQRRIPDLVLSDVMMPRLDGLGLVRALRADPRTQSVPIILLSARADEGSIEKGMGTLADDYLLKPFSNSELLARISTHLALSRTRRAWAAELERANQELDAFSYSVSHDLRAPLRAIDGFSRMVLSEYATALDERGRHYIQRIRAGTERMSMLVDDLLALSKISRMSLKKESIDLTLLATQVLAELRLRDPARVVEAKIAEGIQGRGDTRLVRIALENLLGNAWKFTSKRSDARIEFGETQRGPRMAFYIRDNGAGFDMAYADKLFGAFQRLHTPGEFEGTGIGLATVQRIVTRHGGKIWAESQVDHGATFFFTLEPER